jgi:hypothetical protein
MDINVKHIFKSDLDPNSTLWWSVDKIDKINYNFELLKLGGPQGPLGRTGSTGDIGYGGDQGFIGSHGDLGAQGSQGAQGIEPWKLVDYGPGELKYILPKFNGDPQFEDDVIRVVFSDYIIDDFDGDGIFQPGEIVDTVQSPVDYADGILTSYTHDPNYNNIEFRTSDDNSKSGILDIYEDGTNEIFEIYASNAILFKDAKYHFKNYLRNEVWLYLDDKFELTKNSKFNLDLEANQVFKYTTDAIPGHILASDDNLGNLSWKAKLEVFDTLPIGSIISIPYIYFNSDNFNLDRFVSSTESNSGTFEFKYGRGKSNSQFAGWYLCHGETWKNSNYSYDTPNLNSFSYQIDSNNNGQVSMNSQFQKNILLGGAKITNLAEEDGVGSGPGLYRFNITQTMDQSDINITLSQGTSTETMSISRNVHIVYLGQEDLFWVKNMLLDLDISGPGEEELQLG